MFLFKKEKLDERQLLIRGNIFKHGFLVLVSLIFCNALLGIYGGFEWATGKWPELTILLFAITVCCVEFILYDIYPLTEKRQRYLIYFMGAFGVVSIGACLYEMLAQNIPALVEGTLTPNALGIVYGGMFLSICLTYIGKAVYNKKVEQEA